MALVRKNIRMAPKIAQWYELKAKELGVSQSNLMIMALSDYIRQDKTIDAMGDMKDLLNQLQMTVEDPKK